MRGEYYLVNDTVRGTAGISAGSSSRLSDGVQLVKEEDAGRGGPGLVEDVPHVGLGLSEPHGQQLGALDGDEVGLTLVGYGLGQKRLTCKMKQNYDQ